MSSIEGVEEFISYIEKGRIKDIVFALDNFDIKKAMEKFSMKECQKANIYPDIWNCEDEIDKIKEELMDYFQNLKDFYKKILEMMGIFLSVFSVIGLGIVGILNIQDNLPTNILLIMGSILIVITLLFALIKYNSENKCKFFIITTIGLILIGIGISLYKPTDKNWEETKIKIESLEKRLDYEKRINELERKSK